MGVTSGKADKVVRGLASGVSLYIGAIAWAANGSNLWAYL